MIENAGSSPPFPVIEGGKTTLSGDQRRAVSFFADVVRGLTPEQTGNLIEIIEQFRGDEYLERVRSYEPGAVKVLADVINGWEPDGIYEFTRAWISTLVARKDSFDWAQCSPEEKRRHCLKIDDEIKRRGLSFQ